MGDSKENCRSDSERAACGKNLSTTDGGSPAINTSESSFITRPGKEFDTWRSWVVLAAGTCVFVVSFGMVTSFGIYVESLLDDFGPETTRSQVALVGSVAYGCMCICGPFSNVLYQLVGCRIAITTGSLIACVGYCCAYFVENVVQLIVCYGVVGVGLGFTVTPTVAAQAEYFEKYRLFAISFITVGSATGLFIFPPIMERLIRSYSWRGSMLFNAGIALQLLICAAIMRSTRTKKIGGGAKKVRWDKVFCLHLFRLPKFLLLCASCVMWGSNCYTFMITMPSYMEHRGISKQTVALLMSLCGMGSIIGRVSASVINQQKFVNRPLLYATAMVVSTTQVWCTLLAENEVGFGCVGFLFGLGFGLMLSSLGPVVVDLFGVDRLPGAQGFLAFFVGAGGFVGPPIAGLLGDSFSDKASFIFAAILGTSGALIAYMIVALNCGCRRKVSRSGAGAEPPAEEVDKDEEFLDAVEEKIAFEEQSRNLSESDDHFSTDSDDSQKMATPNSGNGFPASNSPKSSFEDVHYETHNVGIPDATHSAMEHARPITHAFHTPKGFNVIVRSVRKSSLEVSDEFYGVPGLSCEKKASPDRNQNDIKPRKINLRYHELEI